jgi:uncharacterized tellurite resistance protein B-like protein
MMTRLDRLKLAFAYDVARKIVGADQSIELSEVAFLEASFPWRLLADLGYVGADGKATVAFEAAVAEARKVLPAELGSEDKLALVSLFLEASVADGQFQAEEGTVIVQAARDLGVQSSAFFNHIGTRAHVGTIDLPEPTEDEG